MKARMIGLFALIATTVPGPLLAAPLTYGCDTPSDRFSAIEQDVQTENFFVRGRIKPLEFRESERYAPLAQVYLRSMDGQNMFVIKLISRHDLDYALARLEITQDGTKLEPVNLGAVNLSDELTFEIFISGESEINFRIDDVEGSPTLDLGDSAELNIICSTGEFVFSDLDWGNE